MELGNLPGRALRKYRTDGGRELLREARTLLLEDVLLYRLGYRRYLEGRIDAISRSELRAEGDCVVSEPHEGSMRIKAAGGFRGRPTPERYDPGGRFVCEVPDATLLGPTGPGVTTEGRVVVDTVATPPLGPRRTGVTLAKSMRANGLGRTLGVLSGGGTTPDRRFELATLAVPPWLNYYHWTMECLPRIRLLERYGAETGRYPTLLVPPDPPGWVAESLSMVDYGGDVARFGDGVAAVETLVVPTFPDPTPAECEWLRDRMRPSKPARVGQKAGSARANAIDTDGGERVYVARGDATVRRVANRDELQGVLDRYDIDTYLPGELSVREQVALFSRADLVVGPHGAGLTNIVFGEDLAVIELFGGKQIATFDRLAAALGHTYAYLEGEGVGVDIRVDTDALDRTIARILEE
ncbi:glycosyltransferase family 61 protein [Natronomonas moolapensis]|nr:glycosyltransferase family 61 protein [Natronomonas moolapensis]